jgi:hypothetical protein
MTPVTETIIFRPDSETPTRPEWAGYYAAALLFNQCDGYHHVFAYFSTDDNEFQGFYDWCGVDAYRPGEDYCAWALLPDTLHLHAAFAHTEQAEKVRADNAAMWDRAHAAL